jgi:chromosome segregation ATPase
MADAHKLGNEQSVFERQLNSLTREIRNLRSEMRDLEGSKSGYDDAIQCINILEESCKQLRDQTNLFLKEINAARLALSRGVTKTQGIAAALERCEYARTRKDFVNRVSGVLEDLRGGSQLVGQRPQLAIVSGKLGTLHRRTDGVVSIMSKCI